MIRDPSVLETPEAPALKGGALGTVFSMFRHRRGRRRKCIPRQSLRFLCFSSLKKRNSYERLYPETPPRGIPW